MAERQGTHWDFHTAFRDLPNHRIVDPNGRARPLYLRLETVNLCNNDCIICAYGDQTRTKTFMTFEVFERALDGYREMGGGYLSLTPLVGDPLLDRHLLWRIARLSQCDFVTGIGFTTNGSMADRFSDAELAAVIGPLQRLSLSIYGLDADEYEAMTRKKSYGRMIDGIRRIIAAASAPVWLEFRLLKERPAGFIDRWLVDVVGLAPGDRRIKVNSVAMSYANWGTFDTANRPLPHQATWFQLESAERRPQCLIPLFACMVFSNGNVSFCPCDNFNDIEAFRLGNIMDDSLPNLFNSAKAGRLWDWSRQGVPDFCRSCSFHIPLDTAVERPDLLDDPHQIVGAG